MIWFVEVHKTFPDSTEIMVKFGFEKSQNRQLEEPAAASLVLIEVVRVIVWDEAFIQRDRWRFIVVELSIPRFLFRACIAAHWGWEFIYSFVQVINLRLIFRLIVRRW